MMKYVCLKTGIRLHYTEQGDPAGKTLILLHGYGDSWRSFSLMLPEISTSFRIFAIDLRGHGNSDKPEGGYCLKDFESDIEAFMDAVGIEKADIGGHSLGSLIAQMFAAHHPDRVRRLLLLSSTAAATDNAILVSLKAEVDSLTDPVRRVFVEAFQEPSTPLPRDFMEIIISESMKLPAYVWQEVLSCLLKVDNSSILSSIEAPTFIAWGRNDAIFTCKDQENLLSKIPHAIFREYDAGHAVLWEKSTLLAEDIVEFLKC
jgi:non-heme chloroperoxidase